MSPETPGDQDDPLLGRVLCGCEILERVGHGGMGNVYKARQFSLDRVVALKVLSAALGANQEFLGRFRREARALANLVHTNIVAVYDFGSEADTHAIVMEYVPGESVADMLAATNLVPVLTATDIVRQVAEGLGFAHRQQIIHCDLKPENILVTPDGVAKVVDFGLAKSLGGDAVRITQDGAIFGTPPYMSPEQCEGIPLDARTDIYSLGATFFRMIAGRDVFEADNPFAIMLKHKTEPPPDPRDFNPDIPPTIAKVLLRMLEKDRENRYQSAEDVGSALVAALDRDTTGLAAQAEPVTPTGDLPFVRDALDSGALSVGQVRECLGFQDELRKVGVAESLAALMVKRDILDEATVAKVLQHGTARESYQKDRQLTRIVLETGMAPTEKVAACVEVHKRRTMAGSDVKLSAVMVEQGVLDRQQVVRILLRQLKEAQQREDDEFLELVRGKRVITDAQIDKCRREQQREEAKGHHKLLRQLAVDLGLIPAPLLRDLLYEKTRSEIEQLLAEQEATAASEGAAIVFDEDALRLEDSEPCPACGATVKVGSKNCPACGSNIEQARREAARRGALALDAGGAAARAGSPRELKAGDTVVFHGDKAAARRASKTAKTGASWELRLPSGEPSQPVTFGLLVKLAREKRLHAHTILRGPLTRGVWRQARHTPKLCRLFGVCHYCEARIRRKALRCSACGARIDQPVED